MPFWKKMLYWISAAKKYYHFSLRKFEIGAILYGMKYAHKKQQRVGQKVVDEIFEEVASSPWSGASRFIVGRAPLHGRYFPAAHG